MFAQERKRRRMKVREPGGDRSRMHVYDLQNRRAGETPGDTVPGFDCAFARLTGIARLIEWFQTPAYDDAGAEWDRARKRSENMETVVENQDVRAQFVVAFAFFDDRSGESSGASGNNRG